MTEGNFTLFIPIIHEGQDMQSDRIPNQFSKVSITEIDDPETTSWRLDSQVGRITDAPLNFV